MSESEIYTKRIHYPFKSSDYEVRSKKELDGKDCFRVLFIVSCSFIPFILSLFAFYALLVCYINNNLVKVIYSLIYLLLLIMHHWCYLSTIFCKHGKYFYDMSEAYYLGKRNLLTSAGDYFHKQGDLHNQINKFLHLPGIERLYSYKRILCRTSCCYCKILSSLDRSTHCKRCRRCINVRYFHSKLMMNCISQFNIKFYILTCFYGALLFLMIFISSCYMFLYNLIVRTPVKILYFDLIFYSYCIAILSIILSFTMFCYYIYRIKYLMYYVQHNITKPEMYFGERKLFFNLNLENPFSLGTKNNLIFIFGNKIKWWFLPIDKTENSRYFLDNVLYTSRINGGDTDRFSDKSFERNALILLLNYF